MTSGKFAVIHHHAQEADVVVHRRDEATAEPGIACRLSDEIVFLVIGVTPTKDGVGHAKRATYLGVEQFVPVLAGCYDAGPTGDVKAVATVDQCRPGISL